MPSQQSVMCSTRNGADARRGAAFRIVTPRTHQAHALLHVECTLHAMASGVKGECGARAYTRERLCNTVANAHANGRKVSSYRISHAYGYARTRFHFVEVRQHGVEYIRGERVPHFWGCALR